MKEVKGTRGRKRKGQGKEREEDICRESWEGRDEGCLEIWRGKGKGRRGECEKEDDGKG